MSWNLTEDRKRSLSGRAMTLLERLADPDGVVDAGDPGPDAGDVVDAWQRTFPDALAFERRLEQLGMTKAAVRKSINADRLAPNEPIPEWVGGLEEIVGSVHGRDVERARSDPSRTWTTPDGWNPSDRPFGELSATIAMSVLDRLAGDIGGARMAEEAAWSLLEWLQMKFENRFSRLLVAELRGNVEANQPELLATEPGMLADPPSAYYDGYVEYLFDGGFGDLCLEYPMFGRLLESQVRGFRSQVRTFLSRLSDDRDRLAYRFGDGCSLGEVVALDGLNRGGFDDDRAVLRVEFASGLVVVYKPRSVAADAEFYEVLEWVDAHASGPTFDSPTFLAGDGYGWMEWVAHEECADEAAVERYYHRAGTLTCLAYFLGVTDCTVENLVAAGEQPILVDVETVLQPHVTTAKQPVDANATSRFTDTVIESGLLPFSIGDGEEGACITEQVAGFAGSSDPVELDRVTIPVVRAPNTDVMTVEREARTINRSGSVPVVDGEDYPPSKYLSKFRNGFTTTYRAILELRDEGLLLDPGSPLSEFEDVETRLLYRNWYEDILNSLAAPKRLQDGARFGLAFEPLAVPFCTGQMAKPRPGSLFDAERTALKRMEKPRFSVPAGNTAVRMDGRPTGFHVDASGLQRCRERIESANEADLQAQVLLIQDCLLYSRR